MDENWLEIAEANRREKSGGFSTVPVDGITDYGVSLAKLAVAVAHLEEAIPNGQTERTVAAFMGMIEAFSRLADFLEAKDLVDVEFADDQLERRWHAGRAH